MDTGDRLVSVDCQYWGQWGLDRGRLGLCQIPYLYIIVNAEG